MSLLSADKLATSLGGMNRFHYCVDCMDWADLDYVKWSIVACRKFIL